MAKSNRKKQPVNAIRQERHDKQRERYRKSLRAYSASLGEQFSSSLDRLAHLIGDAHFPTLGRYKEQLLTDVLRRSLPERFGIGTGFVVFPRPERIPLGKDSEGRMEFLADHDVSRQLDIIVYDRLEYPRLFQDGEFVVVLPEAVRAVVEIKGSLNPKELDDAVSSFCDFGKKWSSAVSYQQASQLPKLTRPLLMLLAWSIRVDSNGAPTLTAESSRERIVKAYRNGIDLVGSPRHSFPFLDHLFGYREFHIYAQQLTVRPSGRLATDDFEEVMGYVDESGLAPWGIGDTPADTTIADLIAAVLASLGTPFNALVAAPHRPGDKIAAPPGSNFSEWCRGDAVFQLATEVIADLGTGQLDRSGLPPYPPQNSIE